MEKKIKRRGSSIYDIYKEEIQKYIEIGLKVPAIVKLFKAEGKIPSGACSHGLYRWCREYEIPLQKKLS
jgi:hypothetical protein